MQGMQVQSLVLEDATHSEAARAVRHRSGARDPRQEKPLQGAAQPLLPRRGKRPCRARKTHADKNKNEHIEF